MSEWWTYRPSDFLLFSPRTYFRLMESYNRDVWPAHLVAILCVLGIAILAVRGREQWGGKAAASVLAVAWLWVGWAFLLERYATINWAARWFAAGFALEALLLVWTGVMHARLQFGESRRDAGATAGETPALRPSSFRAIRTGGLTVTLFALFLEPVIGPMAGRSWGGIEVFGIHPDPTAIATLGIALLDPRRNHWAVLIVPLAWCAVSGATLYEMQSPDWWTAPVAALVTIGIASWKAVELRRPERR